MVLIVFRRVCCQVHLVMLNVVIHSLKQVQEAVRFGGQLMKEKFSPELMQLVPLDDAPASIFAATNGEASKKRHVDS